MTFDELYEAILLRRAVEACPLGIDVEKVSDGWLVGGANELHDDGIWKHSTTSLADALTALLRDLGVEPPERPSAERVGEAASAARGAYRAEVFNRLRDLADRDPLDVLALLFGGES